MRVPFLDLGAAHREVGAELDAAYRRVMSSHRYILDAECEAFEREFADYCGAAHCVGVANGLEALHLAMRGSGIGSGDEVIVPANTYIATWLAISQAGAVPVPVEPDELTFNLDASRIERALTDRTKAVMPVHLFGQCADMDAIGELAAAAGLLVIDDAAQAHGASWNRRRTGALGHAAAFSFYPTKNLGAIGDGGAVVTNDAELADRLRLLRNYGSRRKYHNEVRGFNSRLDELQAALLRVKLRRLDGWNEIRRERAQLYLDLLGGLESVIAPAVADPVTPTWHVFAIRHPARDEVQRLLTEQGIGTLIHYPIPPHLSEAYRDFGLARGDFPLTERLADESLSLPMHPHLPPRDVEIVVAALREAAEAVG
jgi:dTDP-4-amino-4,6-dideoxygalactose transaminase